MKTEKRPMWLKYESDFLKENYRRNRKGEATRLSLIFAERFPDAPETHKMPRGVYQRLKTMAKHGEIIL